MVLPKLARVTNRIASILATNGILCHSEFWAARSIETESDLTPQFILAFALLTPQSYLG